MNINKDTNVIVTPQEDETSPWIEGSLPEYPGYTFVAKVFDRPAKESQIEINAALKALKMTPIRQSFGIEGGRISKLAIYFNGQSVCNFDRGWDQKPQTGEEKAVLSEILRAFPSTPQ